jgi:hypothetical protein
MKRSNFGRFPDHLRNPSDLVFEQGLYPHLRPQWEALKAWCGYQELNGLFERWLYPLYYNILTALCSWSEWAPSSDPTDWSLNQFNLVALISIPKYSLILSITALKVGDLSFQFSTLSSAMKWESLWPLRSFDYDFLEAIIIIPGGRTNNRMIKNYNHIGSHPVLKTGPWET